MTRDELAKRFPTASGDFIGANLPAGSALPDTEQRERTKALEGSDAGKAPRPGLRHCRFTLRRKKLLDVDAKFASVKDLLDCLAIAGIIRGDKEGEITLEVNQEQARQEETVVEVFEVSVT